MSGQESDTSALVGRYRLTNADGVVGAWSEWQPLASLAAIAVSDDSAVDGEVKDEEGNVGSVSSALVRGRPDPSLKTTGGCGCSAPGSGDTSLAECSKAVRDMLAVCNATQILVVGKPAYVKSAVQLCIDACTDCERACRKHEERHAICKTCAEACAATIKAARAYLA